MDLVVYGMRGVMELATTLIAVDTMSGGTKTVNHGNTAHLVGADSSMSSAASVNTIEAKSAVVESPQAVADVATNADTQLVRYSYKRPDLRILFNITRGLYTIIARRSAGITSVKDLKGRRVGTIPRTSAGYYLFKELQMNGLQESDVEIVGLAPIFELSKAIIENRVDAIAIWEPAAEAAKVGLRDDAVELRTPGVYFEHFNLNTTTEKLADPNKRKQIVEFSRHIIRATKLVNEEPQIGMDWLVKSTGYDRHLIEKSFSHGHEWCASIAEDQLDVLVDQEAWVSKHESRPARKREELSKLLDYSVYEEAMAGL